MRKKFFGFVLSTLLFAQWSPTQAQQSGKMFRIGFLDASTASGSAVLVNTLRQELSRLGWIEGKNITIEYRFAEQKEERLRELAAELVALKVDVLVVTGGEPALVAKKESSTTPIVMTGASDPIFLGLIASLARPGSNVTGLSARAYELNTKRLEVLKDAFPKLGRVGFLQSTQGSTKAKDFELKELRTAASALKVNVEAIETETNPKALESAFQAAKQKQVEAMMTAASRYFLAQAKRIVKLANRSRLPAAYHQRAYVDQGGLMSYGVDYIDLYRRAAGYVDKILKGAKPGDLPVQQATKFEFVINLKAAKELGLTMPVDLLQRANQVIK